MTEFVWRELTHRFTGKKVAGCFAWHHAESGRPMCDHEHDVSDENFTCEDAYAEMSKLRASAPRTCPDDGRCHHSCAPSECFRVRTCGPLSGVFPGDVWPAAIVKQHSSHVKPFSVMFAEQLAHWERMMGVMSPGPERSAVDDMLRAAKKAVEDVDVMAMLRSFGEMKDMKVSPWVTL